jgi:hypothetical protein
VLAKSLAVGNWDSSARESADDSEPEVGVFMTERSAVTSVVFRAPKLLNEALRCRRVGIWCGITFELTPTAEAGVVSPVRDDATNGTDRAYNACRSGSGAERGVRPHSWFGRLTGPVGNEPDDRNSRALSARHSLRNYLMVGIRCGPDFQ